MGNEHCSHVRAQDQQGRLRAPPLLGQMCPGRTTRVACVSACLPPCAGRHVSSDGVGAALGVLWAISVCPATPWRPLSTSESISGFLSWSFSIPVSEFSGPCC